MPFWLSFRQQMLSIYPAHYSSWASNHSLYFIFIIVIWVSYKCVCPCYSLQIYPAHCSSWASNHSSSWASYHFLYFIFIPVIWVSYAFVLVYSLPIFGSERIFWQAAPEKGREEKINSTHLVFCCAPRSNPHHSSAVRMLDRTGTSWYAVNTIV